MVLNLSRNIIILGLMRQPGINNLIPRYYKTRAVIYAISMTLLIPEVFVIRWAMLADLPELRECAFVIGLAFLLNMLALLLFENRTLSITLSSIVVHLFVLLLIPACLWAPALKADPKLFSWVCNPGMVFTILLLWSCICTQLPGDDA